MLDFLTNPGSYLGIFFFLVLTGCGLPIPEEVGIIAAGVLSSGPDAELNVWLAFLSCLLGAMVGDSIMYGIGYYFGRGLINNHPKLTKLLHAEREAQIEEMLSRHGVKVLLAARFMVGVRGPVYLTAGILRMRFRQFLLIEAFCATIVVGVFFWLSHAYGRDVGEWIKHSQFGVTVVVVAAVVLAAAWFYFRRRRRLSRLRTILELRDQRRERRALRDSQVIEQDSEQVATRDQAG